MNDRPDRERLAIALRELNRTLSEYARRADEREHSVALNPVEQP